MSVNVEFTKALPVSGVDTHVTVSLPGRLTLGVELDNWKLMMAWKPASSGPAGLTTLYHYRVRPFTALQAIGTDLPVNPSPGESKDVHAFGVTPQTVPKCNVSLFLMFLNFLYLYYYYYKLVRKFFHFLASISNRWQIRVEIGLDQQE